jgi:hypothetical protein
VVVACTAGRLEEAIVRRWELTVERLVSGRQAV